MIEQCQRCRRQDDFFPRNLAKTMDFHGSAAAGVIELILERQHAAAIGLSGANADFQIAEEFIRQRGTWLANRHGDFDVNAADHPVLHRLPEQNSEGQRSLARQPEPVLEAADRQLVADVHFVVLQRSEVGLEWAWRQEVRERRRLVAHLRVDAQKTRIRTVRE